MAGRSSRSLVFALVFVSCAVAACTRKSPAQPSGSGGTSAAGGAIGSGGVTAAGGTTSRGGATGSGGTSNIGGIATTGGATDSGSFMSSGGATGSGGVASTNSTKATGGSSSNGANTAAGGTTDNGGGTATGGTTSSGGNTAAGGATNSGAGTATGGTTSSGGATSSTGAAYPFPQNYKGKYCSYPTTYDNDKVTAAYQAWKDATITSDGASGFQRVKKPDSGTVIGSTVSEGIGYGMILAVYLNDQKLFDNLWNY
jgi:hypothetical protein